MKIFKLILAANETRDVVVRGQYFELRTALYKVDVELLDRASGVVSLLQQAQESDYTREGVFELVRITNGATAQTIEFWYGFGDAGSRRFSGAVTGTVGLDVATLAALESVDLNTATLNALTRPKQSTANTSATIALAANTPENIVLPAANVSGLIVLSAFAAYGLAIGTTYGGGLLAKTSAPGSITDGERLAAVKAQAQNGTDYSLCVELLSPVFVPAGQGLYWMFSNAMSAGFQRSARFIVL